jgi:hypothetical protein
VQLFAGKLFPSISSTALFEVIFADTLDDVSYFSRKILFPSIAMASTPDIQAKQGNLTLLTDILNSTN